MKKFLFLFLCFGLIKTYGQKQLYFNTGSGQWDANNYWSGNSAAGPFNLTWVNGSDAYFTSPNNGNVSFPPGISYRPVVRHIFSTAVFYSIIGNPASSLQLASYPGTTSIISVKNGSELFIQSNINGGNGFIKDDLGKLTLSLPASTWANRFHGTVNISKGILNLNADNFTPRISIRYNKVDIGNGAQLTYAGTNQIINLGTLSGTGTIDVNNTGNSIAQFLTASGSTGTSIISPAGLMVLGTGNSKQTFTGNLSSVQKTLTLQGINTFNDNYSVTLNIGSPQSALNGIDSIFLRGGKLFIDNSAGVAANRFSTTNQDAVPLINMHGGALHIKANVTGSNTINIGSTSTYQLGLNSGASKIILETPAGTQQPLILNINTPPPVTPPSDRFNFRGSYLNAVIDFTSLGGALGGTNSDDPRIFFSNSQWPMLFNGASPNLMASTHNATGGVGWATVNGNTWATYSSTKGVKTAVADATVTSGAALCSFSSDRLRNIDFTVLNNDQLSLDSVYAQALRIIPSAGVTTLDMKGFSFLTNALMYCGHTDFTIINSAGGPAPYFGTTEFKAPRYIHIPDANAALSVPFILGSQAVNNISIVGPGFLVLNNTVSQLPPFNAAALSGTTLPRVNLLSGFLRADSVQVKMTLYNMIPYLYSDIQFRGGVFEIANGANRNPSDGADFQRQLGGNSITGGNGNKVNWSRPSNNENGSGGFSAFGGDVSVSLKTTTTSISPQLQWGGSSSSNQYFIQNGYSLMFGSPRSDSKLTFWNPILLDAQTANTYWAREVYVFDNVNSNNDKTCLAGILSGSNYSDFVKAGPGVLELSAVNTYAGSTLVHQGTLIGVNAGSLSSSSTFIVYSGATLKLGADQKIANLILEAGSILDMGGFTLTITGEFTNNGGVINNAGGLILQGTSEQLIDGSSLTLKNLTLNNTQGASLLTPVTITDVYTPQSGVLTTNDNLTLRSDANKTARIGVGSSAGGYINGKVMIERYCRQSPINGVNGSWGLLTAPVIVGEATINSSWMEGATPIAGYTNLNDPSPGYGMPITAAQPYTSIANGYDQNPTGKASLFTYDAIADAWKKPDFSTYSTDVTAYPGYYVFIRGSRAVPLTAFSTASSSTVLRVKGQPKQGDMPALPLTTPWTLVGNPYPSPVNWKTVTKTSGVADEFYIKDRSLGTGTWVYVYRSGAGYVSNVPASQQTEMIQSGQAFFAVKSANAVGPQSISIKESDKATTSNNSFRVMGTQPGQLQLNIYLPGNNSQPAYIDGATVLYDSSYHADVVAGEDIGKFSNSGENLILTRQNKSLMLERRPQITGSDTVFVQFSNLTKNIGYHLTVKGVEVAEGKLTAVLKDNYLNTQTALDLSKDNEYIFSATNDAASMTNRFHIIFEVSKTLAVTYAGINANAKQEGILVEWSVANTSGDVLGYEIQRSQDGINFIKAGEISATGNGQHYSWLDKMPVDGLNYYRIKSRYNNGQGEYTKIVSEKWAKENKGGISIYPILQKQTTFRCH